MTYTHLVPISYLVSFRLIPSEADSEAQAPVQPARTEDLFHEVSCEWTKFYTDESILDNVYTLYAADYHRFSWYTIHKWKFRLQQCSKL